MKSYKSLMNSLSNSSTLRQLNNEETANLRKLFLEIYQDLVACCKKNNLTVMLIGGTALGAVRHKGFIPWDDDFDVAMKRDDFEILKKIFDKELGEKYILSSPNYKNNAKNRFPMILVKDTLLVEVGDSSEDELSKIKMDIFIIENIPDNVIHRLMSGLWCTCLMFIAGNEFTYENRTDELKAYMYKTKEGKKAYDRRMRIGKLFSFLNSQKWFNLVDSALKYTKKTKLMGIPSGRGHYFGEIRPTSTFFPVSQGTFEGLVVDLPGNPHDYLSNLYGLNYMTVPPEEKREKHFIIDIKFKENMRNG